MKLFSLISSAVALTVLPMNGFCDSQMKNLEGRISGLEKTHKISDTAIDHQANQSGYNKSYQSPKPVETHKPYTGEGTETYPKVVLDYARGCHGQNMPYFDLEFLWLRAIEDSLSYAWDVNESSGRALLARGQGGCAPYRFGYWHSGNGAGTIGKATAVLRGAGPSRGLAGRAPATGCTRSVSGPCHHR